MATYKAFEYATTGITIDMGTLTAAATATGSIDVRTQDRKERWQDIIFQYTIAAINTNVVIRAEGSLDDENWFDLYDTDGTITQTSNGTYAMMFDGVGEIDFIRFYFVSESGGTAATIAVKAKITEREGN